MSMVTDRSGWSRKRKVSYYLRHPEAHLWQHSAGFRSKVETVTDWMFPVLVLTALMSTLFFSKVPPSLLVVTGTAAQAVIVTYGLALVATLTNPRALQIHAIAAALGVFAFAGRAGGFLELVIDLGRWDLVAAVVERLVLSVAVLRYHAGRAAKFAIESEIVKRD